MSMHTAHTSGPSKPEWSLMPSTFGPYLHSSSTTRTRPTHSICTGWLLPYSSRQRTGNEISKKKRRNAYLLLPLAVAYSYVSVLVPSHSWLLERLSALPIQTGSGRSSAFPWLHARGVTWTLLTTLYHGDDIRSSWTRNEPQRSESEPTRSLFEPSLSVRSSSKPKSSSLELGSSLHRARTLSTQVRSNSARSESYTHRTTNTSTKVHDSISHICIFLQQCHKLHNTWIQ